MQRKAMQPKTVLAICSSLAFVTSCSSLGGSDLVELYDVASSEGVIEMELGRNGTFLEMEAEIAVAMLPDFARAAALDRAPGAQITGAEREFRSGGRAWEVKLIHEGRAWEIIVDEEGEVVEVEKELQRSEAPAAVLEAADRAIDGGSFRSVEVIERGEEREFHVKKTREGASYKIVLAPDGTVLRKVREQRAEIEVPLK